MTAAPWWPAPHAATVAWLVATHRPASPFTLTIAIGLERSIHFEVERPATARHPVTVSQDGDQILSDRGDVQLALEPELAYAVGSYRTLLERT